MFDVKKLLQYEYFPEELPECFSSKGLATFYNELKGQADSLSTATSPLLFSIYKSEHARRRMSIPNPMSYIRIVNRIVSNESELQTIFDKSQISLTKPSPNQKDTQKRAYNRISNSQIETRYANEKLFSNNTYCIKIDISNFFDSIYTHSVSWAIHTKDIAKREKKNNQLLGNIIDTALQNMNDKQTHGILVGNAVSRIISEIILCDIDDKISKKFPNIGICRYVDDYSFYISEKESTSAIISFVRNQLLEYDLVLNEAKTKIIQAPFILERSGIDEIKSITTTDAYTYYNRMMILFEKSKDISLLKYGFSILYSITKKENIEKLFPLLIHSWVTFPSLAYKILPILYKFKDCYSTQQKKELKKSLISTILYGIELRQEVETVWALWSMTLFEFPINEEIVRKVCASNNDLAIIITLIYIKEKAYKYYFDVVAELCERIKIESTDPTELNREMICFSHWLLIYEMVKNDIFSIMDFPCVNSNRFFKTLLEKNVDFYDPSVAPALEQATGKSQKGNQENIVSDELFRLIELLTSEQNNIDKSTKKAIIESIDQIICGKTENWTY